jgi:hypothetical protein
LLITERITVSVKKITSFFEKRMSQYAEPKCQFDVLSYETLKVVGEVITTVQEYNFPAESRMSEVIVIPSKFVGPPCSGTYSQEAPNVEDRLYGIIAVAIYPTLESKGG